MRAARLRVRHDTIAASSQRVPTESDTFALEHYLLSKWSDGDMTMKELTELSHVITRAGGQGVEKYTVDPSSSGRNHGRKLRSTLAIPSDIIDSLTFVKNEPIWDERLQQRVCVDFPLRLPHDALTLDHSMEPESYNISRIDEDDWRVDSFMTHPVTLKYGYMHTIPIGFYTDKVSYAKQKIVFAIQLWLYVETVSKNMFCHTN